MSNSERIVKGILGTKLGMTQLWDENNKIVPVTVIQAGPCVVTQVRTPEKDGYSAVQLGFGAIASRKVTKPAQGHFDKAGVTPRRHLLELRTANASEFTLGQERTAELPGEIFDVQTNIPLIHQVVVAQLAAARQGTHSTKTRGEVRGGGSKPWRQKGTGRARHGSRRSPIWTGGGTVHGPKPRDYSQRTPKKMIAAALRGSLSDRARDGQVFVVSELVPGEVPSTRTALETLEQLGELKKVLVVLDRFEEVAWLSLRNIPTVHVLAVDQLNAYDVLVADSVVFTSAALAAFTNRGAEAVASESEATEPAGSAKELEKEEEK